VSVTTEYYFNAPHDLPALAEELSGALGCDLKPYKGDEKDYFARFMGMEFSLGPCDLESDGELEYESFAYEVSFRTSWGAAHWRPIQLPTLLCVVKVLQQRFEYEGMLVYDLDVLLARYEKPTFADRLSGTTLDDFATHLEIVKARIP
jgi:hypothetical protein